jgi:hypothetical protein
VRRQQLLTALCAVAFLVPGFTRGQSQIPPKPGPEHKLLEDLVGTWDATMKMGDAEIKGSITYKMELGGLWLVSTFQADLGPFKMEGKGLDCYDPVKRKYVGVWVDSMSSSPMVMEGTAEKEGKIVTMTGDGPGPDGKPAKYRSVTERKDKNTIVFNLYVAGTDGKEQTFTVNYKRKL